MHLILFWFPWKEKTYRQTTHADKHTVPGRDTLDTAYSQIRAQVHDLSNWVSLFQI